MSKPYIFYDNNNPATLTPNGFTGLTIKQQTAVSAANELLLQSFLLNSTDSFAMKILKAPYVGGTYGAIVQETISFKLAKAQDGTYTLNIGDVVGGVGAGYIIERVAANNVVAWVARAGLAAGATKVLGLTIIAATATVTYGLLAQGRNDLMEAAINDWFDGPIKGGVDIRYTDAQGVHDSGLISDNFTSDPLDQYLYASNLITELKGNLDGGKITFHDGDGQQFGRTYNIYDGDIIQALVDVQTGVTLNDVLAAGGATPQEKNAYHYMSNKEGKPFLYFNEDEEHVIYAPIRSAKESGKVDQMKIHLAYEGSASKEDKIFGDEAQAVPEESYRLIMDKGSTPYIKSDSEGETILLGSKNTNAIASYAKGGESFAKSDILIGGSGTDHFGVFGWGTIKDVERNDRVYVNNEQVTGGIKEAVWDVPTAWNPTFIAHMTVS